MGRLLAKSIYDDVRLPLRFNPAVFRFIAGAETATMEDYTAFDPRAAQNLHNLLAADDQYLQAVGLEFEDLAAPAGGHPPGSVCSKVPSSGPVTAANVKLYCAAFAETRVLGCRRAALQAIRKGFQFLPI